MQVAKSRLLTNCLYTIYSVVYMNKSIFIFLSGFLLAFLIVWYLIIIDRVNLEPARLTWSEKVRLEKYDQAVKNSLIVDKTP
jgi:hypothetical protein